MEVGGGGGKVTFHLAILKCGESWKKVNTGKKNTKNCFPFNSILIRAWVDLHYWGIRKILYVCFLKKNCYFLAWFSISYAIFSLASWSLLFVPRPFLSSCPPLTFMCVGQFQPCLTRRHRSEAWDPVKVCMMMLVQTCSDSKAICFACH